MLSFKGYIRDIDEGEILESIDEFYGSVDNFLSEAAHNITNPKKYEKANEIAQAKSDEVAERAKEKIKSHLKNYGRHLDDEGEIRHLDDEELYKEREPHLKHLQNLHENNPEEYRKHVKEAQERLPINPHGQNRKTATMNGEKVNGHEVVASVSNKGMSGSVAKIGKHGKIEKKSTCVNSKQSCRGEGPNRIGAPCLGMNGCSAWTGTKASNTVLENMKTMKAHATNGAHYKYSNEDKHDKDGKITKKGKEVAASPHLDYATLEHASLTHALEHAKKETEKPENHDNKHKIAVYRQNTTNEESAMHHDQLIHHLPKGLKKHLATNNYSATIAKGKYDPEHPSDASTHDGVMHNTDFSVKGPEVVHSSEGHILGSNKSSNVQEAEKAMNPEHDKHGNIIRPPQNAYMVAGGHIGGARLRYPKEKKTETKETDPETGWEKTVTSSRKHFNIKNSPAAYKPFEALNKLKTARIYGNEKKLEKGEPENHHNPAGHGHETHFDPHTGKQRTFEYQDHHVHANSPKPDHNGDVDFGKLNDNVGSDERKPQGHQKRYNKHGHEVGSVHISAATASTSNVGASGDVETKHGVKVGDKSGVSNDPFTFPIQHHIDKKDETRINLNHPSQKFEAEHQDRKNHGKNTPIMPYHGHPETKAERGELK